MNIVLISVIGAIILLIIAILILRRIIKKRKNRQLIPEEVLSDFMKAEQMLKDSKGEITPQEILWKIYKERNNVKKFVEPPIETKPKENKLLKLFKRR